MTDLSDSHHITASGHLPSSPEAEGLTGQNFAKRKARKSNKSSYDLATTARLWQVSADLVRLRAGAQPAKFAAARTCLTRPEDRS